MRELIKGAGNLCKVTLVSANVCLLLKHIANGKRPRMIPIIVGTDNWTWEYNDIT